MWTLKNNTPYPADRNWTRDKDGRHVWLVAVKATFEISASGNPTGARRRAGASSARAEHFGDPATTAVKYESDLLAVKPGTDVILNATAYAIGGKPVPTVDVLFRMEGMSKHLTVHGERSYFMGVVGITTTPPRPFTTCAIRYEEAFGGSDFEDSDPAQQRMDMRNPVGKGVAATTASLVHKPAHRIEYPSGEASSAGPAGFGAIASYWSPRAELGGTYDASWVKRKKPLLPDDFDVRHSLCSPADQRPKEWLRGGELVELLNMTPEGGLRFRLPQLSFAYRTRFGARTEEHRGHLATALIEPDKRRVIVTYQTSLRVGRKDVAYLDETTIDEKAFVA